MVENVDIVITADGIGSAKWIRVICGKGKVKKSFEPW